MEELNRQLEGNEGTELRRGDSEMESVRGVKKHKRRTSSHEGVSGSELAPTINN